MKVLDLDKMKKLESLGVDTSKASFVICNVCTGDLTTYDVLLENGIFPEEQEFDKLGYPMYNMVIDDPKPVFCLQDIIDALPYSLVNGFDQYPTYWLEVDKETVLYVNADGKPFLKEGKPVACGMSLTDVLESAYLALVSIYENGLND